MDRVKREGLRACGDGGLSLKIGMAETRGVYKREGRGEFEWVLEGMLCYCAERPSHTINLSMHTTGIPGGEEGRRFL